MTKNSVGRVPQQQSVLEGICRETKEIEVGTWLADGAVAQHCSSAVAPVSFLCIVLHVSRKSQMSHRYIDVSSTMDDVLPTKLGGAIKEKCRLILLSTASIL